MAVKVIGAGLAGCEAAWQLANAGFDVELFEIFQSSPHVCEATAELTNNQLFKFRFLLVLSNIICYLPHLTIIINYKISYLACECFNIFM